MKTAITTISGQRPQQVVRSTTVYPDKTEAEHFSEKKAIFRFYQITWYVLGVFEILLAFRFCLKILGANAFNGFTAFIYGLSEPFARPFYGIVSPTITGSNVVEWSTLIAMAVYAVIAYLLIRFLQLVKPVSQEEINEKIDEEIS
ncbi:MAG: YggT family protein [Candidatus Levyibacteriota bacterium]